MARACQLNASLHTCDPFTVRSRIMHAESDDNETITRDLCDAAAEYYIGPSGYGWCRWEYAPGAVPAPVPVLQCEYSRWNTGSHSCSGAVAKYRVGSSSYRVLCDEGAKVYRACGNILVLVDADGVPQPPPRRTVAQLATTLPAEDVRSMDQILDPFLKQDVSTLLSTPGQARVLCAHFVAYLSEAYDLPERRRRIDTNFKKLIQAIHCAPKYEPARDEERKEVLSVSNQAADRATAAAAS